MKRLLIITLTASACSQNVRFKQNYPEIQTMKANNLLMSTKLNVPIEGKIEIFNDHPRYQLSLSRDSQVDFEDLGHGARLVIINNSGRRLRFEPARNRRDQIMTLGYLRGPAGERLEISIAAIVDNGLVDIEPAIATRAPACITCHATVRSNFVTDFGWDEPSSTYFTRPLNFLSGYIYGDHGGSLSTLTLANDAKFVVPNAPLDGSTLDSNLSSITRLSEYVRYRFSNPRSDIGYSVPPIQTSQVEEHSKVFIGAPKADEIRALLNPGEIMSYFPDMGQDQSPIGITLDVVNKVVLLGRDVECSGDLVMDGSVVIKDTTIKSYRGCRIYTTGVVVMQGSIATASLNSWSVPNLQITSSRAVIMGMGKTAVQDRFVSMWTAPSYFTREFPESGSGPKGLLTNNKAISDEVIRLTTHGLIDDYPTNHIAFYQGIGGLDDPVRNVALKHILVNAPHVHSRYTGAFQGSVIAEFALFSLSKFDFEFDPVFKRVSILPLLDVRKTILDVSP